MTALIHSLLALTPSASEALSTSPPLSAVNLWLIVGGLLALAVLVLSWRLLYPRPQICVSERGILDRNLGMGWIPWDAVEGAYFPRGVDFQGILLRLRPSPRLLKLGRKVGQGQRNGRTFEVRIDLEDSEWNPVDLLQEILLRTSPSAANAG